MLAPAEIARSGAVVAGALPLSGHGAGLARGALALDPADGPGGDDALLRALEAAVADERGLAASAAAARRFARRSTFAHGARYLAGLLAAAAAGGGLDGGAAAAAAASALDSDLSPAVALGEGAAGPSAEGGAWLAVHAQAELRDPFSGRVLAGGAAPPPPSLPGQLAPWLLRGAGAGALLLEVGAGLGQGVVEWVVAGGRAVAVELLGSNAEKICLSRALNGFSSAPGALTVLHAAAGPCARGEGGEGARVVAYVRDEAEASGFLSAGEAGGALEGAALVDLRRAPDGTFRHRAVGALAAQRVPRTCLDELAVRPSPALAACGVEAGPSPDGQLGLVSLLHVSVAGGAEGAIEVLEGGQRLLERGAVKHVLVSGAGDWGAGAEAVERWLRDARYCAVAWWRREGAGAEWVAGCAWDGEEGATECLPIGTALNPASAVTSEHAALFRLRARAEEGPASGQTSGSVDAEAEAAEEAAEEAAAEAAAARALAEYAELHAGILDPGNETAPKRFLVLRAGHGLANTMLEEVTALLVAMLSRRALLFDLSGAVFAHPRPDDHAVFARPLLLAPEALLPFLPPADAEAPPGRGALAIDERQGFRDWADPAAGGGYARYARVLACEDWRARASEPRLRAEHLFGAPFALLNPHHAAELRALFGPGARALFPRLHAFLHGPTEPILDRAAALLRALRAGDAGDRPQCTVGIHLRWHHLAEEAARAGAAPAPDPAARRAAQRAAARAFVARAVEVCAAEQGAEAGGAGVAVWVAGDYAEVVDAAVAVAKEEFGVRALSLAGQEQGTERVARPGAGSDLSGDNSDHAGALADLEVLSRCAHFVGTRLSTFSFVAHARRQPPARPYHLCGARAPGPDGWGCMEVPHGQAGLVAAGAAPAAWPWTPAALERLREDCAGGAQADAPGMLLPV